VLKSRDTYEIMRAEDVGWTANKIVLGKLSGRSAFRQRLKELGIELEGEDAYNKAFQRFKDLADKKADIFDEDLHALVSDGATAAAAEHWQLVRMSQASGTEERPHAKLVLTEAGKERKADADGDGPVDATFKAIERVARSGAELLLFSVNAVTQGTESQGEVTVRLAKGGGSSTAWAPTPISSSPRPRPTSMRSTSCRARSESTRRGEGDARAPTGARRNPSIRLPISSGSNRNLR